MSAEEVARIEEQAFQRMAPVISHEIRNPLAVIGNSAYFIKAKLTATGGVDPKIEKHIGIIESEVKRANETLGEILAFTRMRQPALVTQSVNALVEGVVKTLELGAVKAAFEKAPGDPQVSVDADLIAKCVAHLLRNAAEAVEKGAVRVRVEVDGKLCAVEVADSGPGLAPEAEEKLFTPFSTTKPRGIGLGLAFVRKAVERHNGKVSLKGKPGKGVTARIELPLA